MVIRFRLTILMLAILLLFGLSNSVAASEFDPETPCEAVGRANAAFLGRVVRGSLQNDSELIAGGPPVYRVTGEVTFLVIEPFFGITEAQVTTYSHPDSIFETSYIVGETYLIYGRQNGGQLQTGHWTGNKILAEAASDLVYLRQQAIQPEGARLSGQITERSITDRKEETDQKILKDIVIRIEDSEGKYFDVTTDEQGHYQIDTINPGRYKIYPLIPERFVQEDLAKIVEIGQYGCVEQTFALTANGRITGQVRDANGRPVDGVRVYLQSAGIKTNLRSADTLHTHTDEQGNYLIEKVPSGKYFLGFYLMPSPDNYEPIEPLFFPGVSGRKTATELTMGLGEGLNGYNLTLSPQLTLWRLNGKVIWSDGSPVAGAVVSLRDQNYPQLVANIANSDNQGRFNFKIYSEIGYYVNVKFTLNDEKTKQARLIEAEPQTVQLTGDINDFQVVLPRPKKNKR